ncbi:glutamyl-tRNA amidotransferase [Mycoplasmopsis pullorum]|uniref:Asp-tRNA(Asn)/Glu-tRNA(Gln) amidotransferase subunit GatC n=1 Tax=Mycoplasmopsis pullorum TaxID=48003 RepID=UPI001117F4B3|nr:Asp-tRNA(Asn)/Glu-tRNA(Gln) amidotransferase subunit GatC [Mycoplasmopsis pullorum]TNK83338.1 glutamyl-tRNA amidotransferase [Mycoplasmopsis pullorum]TNK92358.1 glutamyl-tRNA amidotransferase [Mycoplasmopsis pullorum]
MKQITREKLIEIAHALMLEPTEEVLNGILLDWEELQKNLMLLKQIDTHEVEPMTHINETYFVDFLREDEVDTSYSISKKEILSNAHESDSDYIITKKVVK